MLERRFDNLIFYGILFLVFGIFISVTIPSLFHILAALPSIYFTFKYLKKGYKLPKSSYFLIALIITGYISNFINLESLNDPLRSFGKQKYYIFGILSIFAFKHAFKNAIANRRIKILLNIFFFTIIAAAIYGTFKYRYNFDLLKMKTIYTDHYRNGGFTGIMRYGYGTGFVLSFLLGIFLYRKKLEKIISKKWFYSSLVLGGIGFVLSFTRGAMLGTLCSVPFIVYAYHKKWGKVTFVAVVSIILLLVTIAFTGGNSSSRFFSKITQSSNLKRLSQYHTAVLAFAEKPAFGHGVNQFSSECPRIKKENDLWYQNYCSKYNWPCSFPKKQKEHYCSHSHNIFLEIAANMGLFGFIFLCGWIFTWLYEMHKRDDLLGKLYIPFIINFLVASQFEMVFDANNSFLIFLLYPISFLKEEDLFEPIV